MKEKMPIIKLTLFILMIINLLIIFEKIMIPTIENRKLEKSKGKNEVQEEIIIKPNNPDEGEPLNVATLSEKDRITIYFSEYIRAIEERNYNQAYDYLYDSFKKNYFPTVEEYIKYILEQDLPSLMAIEYKDIYRQDEGCFILDVVITDAMGISDKAISQLIVVQEYAENDFKLNFEMNNQST